MDSHGSGRTRRPLVRSGVLDGYSVNLQKTRRQTIGNEIRERGLSHKRGYIISLVGLIGLGILIGLVVYFTKRRGQGRGKPQGLGAFESGTIQKGEGVETGETSVQATACSQCGAPVPQGAFLGQCPACN